MTDVRNKVREQKSYGSNKLYSIINPKMPTMNMKFTVSTEINSARGMD